MQQKANSAQGRLKKLFNRYFDYRAWSDWKRTRSMTSYFVNVFTRLFIPRKINPEEAKQFDVLVQEMGLTEEDLQSRLVNFRRMYLAMIAGSFAFYAYAMYQILYLRGYAFYLGLFLSQG